MCILLYVNSAWIDYREKNKEVKGLVLLSSEKMMDLGRKPTAGLNQTQKDSRRLVSRVGEISVQLTRVLVSVSEPGLCWGWGRDRRDSHGSVLTKPLPLGTGEQPPQSHMGR